MLMNTGTKPHRSESGLLTTIAWGVDGTIVYALEGSVFVAGAAVQWLRDELGLISNVAETEAIVSSIDDTGGVYLVPAFTGLGAPYWDSEARGTLVGLTRGSGRSHLVRAVLESIAYQTADVLRCFERDTGLKILQLQVDGGAAANDFLMQFQADILGIPVRRPVVRETTALGADSGRVAIRSDATGRRTAASSPRWRLRVGRSSTPGGCALSSAAAADRT
jgi:glycerol kinase